MRRRSLISEGVDALRRQLAIMATLLVVGLAIGNARGAMRGEGLSE
jgi:hypothetical protein